MLAVSVQVWRSTFVVISYCVAFALQECYIAYVGSSLPTFRDNFAGCGHNSGFSGLVVSMLASGTQVRGFKPG
jgi:hypothetical protein